jgi:hypothetical protein
MLRVAVIATLASVTALGAGVAAAGAAGLAPVGVAGLAPAGAAGSVPLQPFLTGVSCPTTSMCMAVGDKSRNELALIPLAGIWNGRTWRWMAAPPAPGPVVAVLVAGRLAGPSQARSRLGGVRRYHTARHGHRPTLMAVYLEPEQTSPQAKINLRRRRGGPGR